MGDFFGGGGDRTTLFKKMENERPEIQEIEHKDNLSWPGSGGVRDRLLRTLRY